MRDDGIQHAGSIAIRILYTFIVLLGVESGQKGGVIRYAKAWCFGVVTGCFSELYI
jgi:hypothetical protein